MIKQEIMKMHKQAPKEYMLQDHRRFMQCLEDCDWDAPFLTDMVVAYGSVMFLDHLVKCGAPIDVYSLVSAWRHSRKDMTKYIMEVMGWKELTGAVKWCLKHYGRDTSLAPSHVRKIHEEHYMEKLPTLDELNEAKEYDKDKWQTLWLIKHCKRAHMDK